MNHDLKGRGDLRLDLLAEQRAGGEEAAEHRDVEEDRSAEHPDAAQRRAAAALERVVALEGRGHRGLDPEREPLALATAARLLTTTPVRCCVFSHQPAPWLVLRSMFSAKLVTPFCLMTSMSRITAP